MALPTAEQVTNKYLYGKDVAPTDRLDPAILNYRTASSENIISVSSVEYMNFGAGRFVNSANFEIIESFFNAYLPAGTYSKQAIAQLLGYESYGYAVNQIYLGINDPDHAERAYIWGSTKFKISDDASFVVNADGSKVINNFAIVPNGNDNFDFNGGEDTNIGNKALEPIVDPSDIGRTVILKFDDSNAVPRTTLTLQDFVQDLATVITVEGVDKAAAVIPSMYHIEDLENKLFSSGTTPIRFLDPDGRPIIYGSNSSDTISGLVTPAGTDLNQDEYNIGSIFENVNITFDFGLDSNLYPYIKNGIAYVAGDGNDSVTATGNNDILLGGNGADTLNGNAGNDVLDGGADNDTLNPGTGFDRMNGGTGIDTYQIDADFGNVIISGDTDGGAISLLSGVAFRKVGSGAANTNGLYVAKDENGEWLAGKKGWSVWVSESTATVTIPDADEKSRTIVIENFDINNTNKKYGITFAQSVSQEAALQTNVYVVTNGKDWNQQQRDNPAADPFEARSVTYNAADYLYHYGVVMDGETVTGPVAGSEAVTYFFDGNSQADVLNGNNWRPTQQSLFNSEDSNVHLLYSSATGIANPAGWFGDVLQGYDGDDTITGDGRMPDAPDYNTFGDNDILVGGKGNDAIYGGAGNDKIFAWQDLTHYSVYQHINDYTGLQYDGNEYGSVREALYGGAVTIEEVDEKNVLDGGAGDDVIAGASYDDTMDGGSGVDLIMAGAGRDVVAGGTGNDIIYSDSFYVELSSGSITRDFIAPDVMPGEVSGQGFYSRAYFYRDGVDMDTVFNPDEDYNDLVDGGDGDDIIFGEIGADNIAGGADNDTLFGDRPYSAGYFEGIASGFQKLSSRYHGDDVIDGGTGNDKIIGGGGADYLLGGEGSDTVYGDVGTGIFDRKADSVVPGDEAAAIKASDAGWWGKDFILGGQGADVLVGEGNDDTLDGGDDNDQLYGDWTPEQSAAFSDTAAHTGNDTLYGGAGADQLMGNSGDDTLDGGSGNDNMFGDSYKTGEGFSGTGNDVLVGGAGNDKLYGGEGNDTLTGGSGNDSLVGGDGNDTYVFGGDSGVDILDDTWGSSTLQLASAPVRTVLQGNNVTIYLSGDGSNRIQMGTTPFAAIKTVYVNGQSIDLEISVPDTGSAVIKGTHSNDNFVLSDQYTGSHTLYDTAGENAIQVGDGWLDDGHLSVSIDRYNDYIFVNNANPSGSLEVINSSWNTMNGIYLASGEAVALHIEGDGYSNILQGFSGDDVINGLGGADILLGDVGNDTLDGGTGADMLYGEAGSDTIFVDGSDMAFGGDGDDIFFAATNESSSHVNGGAGADTFHVKASDAVFRQFIITDEVFDVGDVIQLDVNSDSVKVHADYIGILTPDKSEQNYVGLSYLQDCPKEELWDRMQNLTIRFADGEIWDADEIKLRSSAGSALGDYIVGDASANTFHGLENWDDIYGVGGNDTLYGDEGNDQLSGGDGNDVLVGGVGDDWLSGGAGNDVFRFGIGSGNDHIYENDLSRGVDADVIYLESGVNPDDVALAVSGADLALTIKSTSDTLTVSDFFNASETRERNLTVSFNGGTQWDTACIYQEIFEGASGKAKVGTETPGNDSINGTWASNYIFGDIGNDIIDGKNGNDWIDGGTGNDSLTGGYGLDVFRFGVGSGQDLILDSAANIVSDQIRLDFTTGIGDLTIEMLASNQLKIGRHDATGTVTDSVQVNKALGSLVDVSGNQIDVEDSQSLLKVVTEMADRTITLTHNQSDLRVVFLSANEILGTDISDEEKSRWKVIGATKLSGTFGQYDLDGNGTTEEAFAFVENFWNTGVNLIGFLPSEAASNSTFQFSLQRDDGLTFVSTMAVSVQDTTLISTEGNDIIDGYQSDAALFIDALGGNDVIRDSYGNDTVHGGDGNDVLSFDWAGNGNDVYYGDAGDDTLDAGWGTDTIIGGAGNDLYIEGNLWSADHTTIDNSTAASGDVDTLQLGQQGYGMWDYRSLWFTADGNDLLVTQLDALAPGEIRIKDWFDAANPEARLDVIRVQQDDGNIYEAQVNAQFDALVQAMASFAPPASVGAISGSLTDEYQAAWTLATPMAA